LRNGTGTSTYVVNVVRFSHAAGIEDGDPGNGIEIFAGGDGRSRRLESN